MDLCIAYVLTQGLIFLHYTEHYSCNTSLKKKWIQLYSLP